MGAKPLLKPMLIYYIPRIRRIGGCYGFTLKPPAARNGVNAITQKPRDGLFSNLVYTLVVIVSWPDYLFKVVGQRSRSQRQKMMWFFRHFWILISYHIFLLNQVEGAIAIPPSNSAPLPLFCPSVCPSVCPSIGLLTTFSGFCTFADKSLGRNGIELEMQMFPDDLPLANIDADGYCCHFMRSSVRPWAWVCVLHTKRLEEMACNLACWCIQMAYTQHSWMLMDIVVGPSVRLFIYGIFSKVRVGAKEGGSNYWEMAVAITCGYGGYLLPLLAAHSSY